MPPDKPCALDASGNLKDAANIVFYNSESDDVPISGPNLGRGQRAKNISRMQEVIAAEQQVDQHGNIIKTHNTRSSHSTKPIPKKPRTKKHSPQPLDEDEDDEDDDFVVSGSTSGSNSDSTHSKDNHELPTEIGLSSAEIADILPSKTIPANKKRKRKPRSERTSNIHKTTATIEEVEDDDSPRKQSERSRHAVHHIIEADIRPLKSQTLTDPL